MIFSHLSISTPVALSSILWPFGLMASFYPLVEDWTQLSDFHSSDHYLLLLLFRALQGFACSEHLCRVGVVMLYQHSSNSDRGLVTHSWLCERFLHGKCSLRVLLDALFLVFGNLSVAHTVYLRFSPYYRGLNIPTK